MWWFVYDVNGNYVKAVYSDTQPDSSTNIDPSGLINPVFNQETNTWSGNNVAIDDKPSELEQIVMQQAMTIAQMKQMLMQQNKDIAKLKGANV
ncbi:hypothetical protein [Pediococcus pentosaceus]|jgi:hypothetical protein|uniref:hypothetical protein n=1 Tax=Pediococcus pentosaceus TaxID=1255 RepID=UPI002DF639BB|nr:hypothetical protein [Pediococcus pentosaceus]